MGIPVDALIVFSFVSGGVIAGFLAHVYTGYKYEYLIYTEYVHVGVTVKSRLLEKESDEKFFVEELMKK